MANKDMLALSKDDFMRAKIIASIKDLLLTTSFQKLTVTNICEHAGISRSSFYHLFTDIHDALDWETGRLFKKASEQYPFSTDWRIDLTNQITAFMKYELEEPLVFKKIASGMSLVEPSAIFLRTRRRRNQMFLGIIEQWQGKPADRRCEFEIEFFVFGESTAVANWACSMKESPELIAKYIVGCIPTYLGQVLDSGFAAYQARLKKDNP